MMKFKLSVSVLVIFMIFSCLVSAQACNLECKNGGILHLSACSCDCLGYWAGKTCETCNLAQCENGGTFQKQSCLCNCAVGWAGKTCETFVVAGKGKSNVRLTEGVSAAVITNVMVGSMALFVVVGIYLWKRPTKPEVDCDDRSQENTSFSTHTDPEA